MEAEFKPKHKYYWGKKALANLKKQAVVQLEKYIEPLSARDRRERKQIYEAIKDYESSIKAINTQDKKETLWNR